MSRILESVFVIGCALVGFCVDANDGSVMQEAVKVSVQFVSTAQNRVVSHANKVGATIARVPAELLGHIRFE
jgi:hypothetical protein